MLKHWLSQLRLMLRTLFNGPATSRRSVVRREADAKVQTPL
jgi:hypothetical protein